MRAAAGERPDVLGPAEGVVQIEDSATSEHGQGRSVTIWLFRHEEMPREISLADLPNVVRDDANFAWIDLADYAEGDLLTIADRLKLNRVAVETALSRWQRPRIDVFGDDYFVSATIAHLESGDYKVQAGELDVFVGRNYLVSVHKLPLPLSARVLLRARQNPTLMQRDSAYLLYTILDELLEHYDSLREHLEGEVQAKEERALTDTTDDVVEDLLRFKRYAFALHQLAGQHRQLFSTCLRPDFPFVAGEEMSVYFRDLESRLLRLVDDLDGIRESINGAFDIYVSHMTHRTNQIIKVLTIVSAILLPMTVILGFFGTQFRGVPWLYAPGSLVVMIVILLTMAGGILFTFRRMHWI